MGRSFLYKGIGKTFVCKYFACNRTVCSRIVSGLITGSLLMGLYGCGATEIQLFQTHKSRRAVRKI